jgi:hypothetical protein
LFSFLELCVAESNDKDGRFVDLLQRLILNNIVPAINMVYDYSCPSIQNELAKRTCPVCFFISCINSNNDVPQTFTQLKIFNEATDYFGNKETYPSTSPS